MSSDDASSHEDATGRGRGGGAALASSNRHDDYVLFERWVKQQPGSRVANQLLKDFYAENPTVKLFVEDDWNMIYKTTSVYVERENWKSWWCIAKEKSRPKTDGKSMDGTATSARQKKSSNNSKTTAEKFPMPRLLLTSAMDVKNRLTRWGEIDIVAVDVKGKSYRMGKVLHVDLALIQLANSAGDSIIMDLTSYTTAIEKGRFLQDAGVASVLQDARITKVIHASDAACHAFHVAGLRVNNVWDTMVGHCIIHDKDIDKQHPGLIETLREFKVHISYVPNPGGWYARPLTPAQDAWAHNSVAHLLTLCSREQAIAQRRNLTRTILDKSDELAKFMILASGAVVEPSLPSPASSSVNNTNVPPPREQFSEEQQLRQVMELSMQEENARAERQAQQERYFVLETLRLTREGKWLCHMCTYIGNTFSDITCQMCGAEMKRLTPDDIARVTGVQVIAPQSASSVMPNLYGSVTQFPPPTHHQQQHFRAGMIQIGDVISVLAPLNLTSKADIVNQLALEHGARTSLKDIIAIGKFSKALEISGQFTAQERAAIINTLINMNRKG